MKSNILEYYNNLFPFQPYTYQIKVAEALLSGKNVILSVPTGAGKTWASIIPFLYARENSDIHFPKKMIYSLPLRALANSIYEDVTYIVDASIQTGEFSEDIYFENDIIFSTIDQTLSNFLCFPLPLSPRLANINAGALVGSYLVFDEFHLLDKNLSMATTLGSLKMLGNLCRCCIMTATLSQGFMEELRQNLPNYEIITLDDFPEDQSKITSLLPKANKKKLSVLNQKISAELIARKHENKTIVICNRVETAQQIYKDLIALNLESFENLRGLETENIICLHSRFYDEDRKVKEKNLKRLFGKNANKEEHAILIATQVIEAGMDISCKVMHTEISPINSFLQRAGRCARFANETGKIFIYDVLDIQEAEKISFEPESKEDKAEIQRLNNKYLPYQPDVCITTLAELKKYSTLDNPVPKKLIETILGAGEKDIIGKMKMGHSGGFNQDKIKDAWFTASTDKNGAKNHYRNTIRDIQSVEIMIISEDQLKRVEMFPFQYQSLSMYKYSLVGWLNKIVKGDVSNPPPIPFEDDWLIKKLVDAEDVFLENDEGIKYELKEIAPDGFNNLPTKVYVNAKYFGYDKLFGFNWQYQESFNNLSPTREKVESKKGFGDFQKDTFYQHNKALLVAFEKEFLGENGDKLDFVFHELAEFSGNGAVTKPEFIRLIKLMIVLHDYGKLNDSWQSPMQYYQALKEGVPPNEFKEILGHTDFDPESEEDKQFAQKAKLNKRPPHAGVGAYLAQELLLELDEDERVTSSISLAIARHHSPSNSKFPEFVISPKNFNAAKQLMKELSFDLDLETEEDDGILEGFQYGDWEKEQILYLFLVRVLRLCDQKATEDFQKYLNSQTHV
ncbi:CRISPR-associated helicase/endonuclease Cas3 [Flexithrix dorotheae]|uniref:CRISPR-associated helicase/endonuclease Cas3 n=1 Tax=Flexithrix dorotheae TaxID=70993 RepID=UPI00037FCCE1|nr:CRISPR-associated helicase/endonuclease Cas3 [Flexithrix dorotheae]